jgi:hypothetical protein
MKVVNNTASVNSEILAMYEAAGDKMACNDGGGFEC